MLIKFMYQYQFCQFYSYFIIVSLTMATFPQLTTRAIMNAISKKHQPSKMRILYKFFCVLHFDCIVEKLIVTPLLNQLQRLIQAKKIACFKKKLFLIFCLNITENASTFIQSSANCLIIF